MKGYAPDGGFLSVSPDGKDWHIRLTRIHENRCHEFAERHGGTVTVAEVRRFLPNWDSLEWKHSRKDVGPSIAVTAADGEIRWALITMEGCTLTEEQIIKEFRQFMADGECE